jgi:hypothetical protein
MKNLDLARHESAHVVSAWRLGGTIRNVTISGPVTPEHQTPAYCEVTLPRDKALNCRDVDAEMKADFAPSLLHTDLEKLPGGCINDIHQGMKRLCFGGPEQQKIAADAAKLLQRFPEDEGKAAQTFFNKYRERADNITDEPGREAVEKLARRLHKSGRLTGFETVKFLENIWTGSPPPEARPAADHPTGLRGDTTPANGLEAAKRLVRMAFEILREHGDPCEPAAHKVLNCIFSLEGIEI